MTASGGREEKRREGGGGQGSVTEMTASGTDSERNTSQRIKRQKEKLVRQNRLFSTNLTDSERA